MTIDEFMRDIAPKINIGWIAMDKDGEWWYYIAQPIPKEDTHTWYSTINARQYRLCMFDIDPVDNWEESLRKIKE